MSSHLSTNLVRSASRLMAGLALALGVSACATNPATGQREFSLMSEAQEIQIGQQYDAEVRREMGIYNDPQLQQYVERIGQRLASASERPQLPWHFAVVDEPAINAFALPGGYIYLTRGIMPFLDDEAELAGVLGHEIGHVTARHAAQAYTQATSAGLGLTVLSIFVPETRPLQGAAETALGLLFLKYGRDDELQADRLGVRYAAQAGWDPRGVPDMLRTLARLDEADGSRRGVPNWLASHPQPADRVEKIEATLASVPAGERAVNREEFVRRIDGIVYGDSPDEGIMRGGQFQHAALRFALAFPQGWEVTNMPEQVVAKAPSSESYVVLQLVSEPRGTLESIARTSMTKAGFRQIDGGRRSINGLDAYAGTFQGTMQNLGQVIVRAAFIAHENNVFMLAGLAPQNTFPQVDDIVTRSILSFRPLSRAQAAEIRPNLIDLYVVRAGDTWQSLAARAGDGTIKASTLAIMNNSTPDQRPQPGERIKIVVQG